MENEDFFDSDNEEYIECFKELKHLNFDEVDDYNLSQNKTIDIMCEEKDAVLKKKMEYYSEIIKMIPNEFYINVDNIFNDIHLPKLTIEIMKNFIDDYDSISAKECEKKYFVTIKKLFGLIIKEDIPLKCYLMQDKSRFYKKYYYFQYQVLTNYTIYPGLIRNIINLIFNIKLSSMSGHLEVSLKQLSYKYKNLKKKKETEENKENEEIDNEENKKEKSKNKEKFNLTKYLNNSHPILFTIYNNSTGKEGLRLCACGNCYICKNREKKQNKFDVIIKYLNNLNLDPKENELPYTQLLFNKRKKKNSPNNINGYKCSFCNTDKLYLTKIFCDHFTGIDHLCVFYMCNNCYQKFYEIDDYSEKEEICPNCGKFYVNFSQIAELLNYLNYLNECEKNKYFNDDTIDMNENELNNDNMII